MGRTVTPTVRLRRLAVELRTLRAEKGLTREVVSTRTHLNEVTLWRLETGRVRPQGRTLLALLDLYEAPPERRERLMELVRDAGDPGWLRSFPDELPEAYAAFINFEAEARGVREYESLFVPGLLQTEHYARAVITGTLPAATEQEVEDRVQARMQRQAVLARPEPLKLWAVVDEAALRRLVGGADVMRDQLDQLVAAAARPNVTVQVIPYDGGAHPGMAGAFMLLDFTDPLNTDLVYIESMAGELFLEAEPDVPRYVSIFDHVRAVALSPQGSLAAIKQMTRDLG